MFIVEIHELNNEIMVQVCLTEFGWEPNKNKSKCNTCTRCTETS